MYQFFNICKIFNPIMTFCLDETRNRKRELRFNWNKTASFHFKIIFHRMSSFRQLRRDIYSLYFFICGYNNHRAFFQITGFTGAIKRRSIMQNLFNLNHPVSLPQQIRIHSRLNRRHYIRILQDFHKRKEHFQSFEVRFSILLLEFALFQNGIL
ncbi:hypothetical protein MmiHf6_08450 [Methanimicrococcus hongohii]|uniref:Uncharacterized protein n=1 Tax=Methanimicrococcus hongohii TaxID=3028295 RepID=A0AA96V8S8_9EURY|nr:hypothetical protein MmiHf6_08450 [Methanimicrococcus sp. Hf6]